MYFSGSRCDYSHLKPQREQQLGGRGGEGGGKGDVVRCSAGGLKLRCLNLAGAKERQGPKKLFSLTHPLPAEKDAMSQLLVTLLVVWYVVYT